MSSYNWDVNGGCTPSNLTGPCGDHSYLRNSGRWHFETIMMVVVLIVGVMIVVIL